MKTQRRRYTAHSFLAVLLLFAISTANSLWHDRSEMSDTERRRLADIPEFQRENLVSGVFAEGFDRWISDRFVLRNQLLEMSRAIENFSGLRGGPQLVQVRSGDLFAAEPGGLHDTAEVQIMSPEENGLPPDSRLVSRWREEPALHGALISIDGNGSGLLVPPAKPEPAPAPPLVQTRQNAILILGNQGFEVVRYEQNSAAYYADAVRRFSTMAGDSVATYMLVAPSHLQQIDPALYGGPLGADQAAGIKFMYERAGESVTGVDVFDALSDRNLTDIYFRTDHHWTARGAYLAYRQFAMRAHLCRFR